MFSKLAASASLLAVASQVNALGSAIIKNQCSGNVYLWTTSNTPGTMQTIASGSTYTEGYLINPDGGGISMKLSMEPDLSGPVTQYEYTIAGNLWYDISNINGFPFMASGLTLTPSISSCRSMLCPAGVELCSAAYNQPDDNEATAACDQSADTTLVLCSNNAASSSSKSAPASAAVAQAAVVASSSSSYSAAAPSSTYVAPTSSYVAPSSTYTPPSSTYVPPPSSTYVPPPSSTYVPSSTSTYVAPPPPTTTSTSAPAPTTTSAAPSYSAPSVGGVTTTFVTQVQTVTADAPPATTPAPTESAADWSFFHHPASLGAFWDGDAEKREEKAHPLKQRVAHKHHHRA